MSPIDPKSLVPRDKHDHERAIYAIEAGYPAVAPVLPKLLEWLQDMNWPVARTLQPFLGSIGLPLIPYIRDIFKTDDEVWKYWIMGTIMLDSREVAESFRDDLIQIAYTPTERERCEKLPEQAVRVLEQYGWEQS